MQPASTAASINRPLFIALSPGRIAERSAEPAFNFVARGAMVLGPAVGDLERAHHGAKFTRSGPVPAMGDAVKQPGAIRIAAAGGIHYRLRRHAGHLVALAGSQDHRALRAQRVDQRLDLARKLLELAP